MIFVENAFHFMYFFYSASEDMQDLNLSLRWQGHFVRGQGHFVKRQSHWKVLWETRQGQD